MSDKDLQHELALADFQMRQAGEPGTVMDRAEKRWKEIYVEIERRLREKKVIT